MEVQVCAQWELEARSERPFDTSTAPIRIGGPGSQPPTLRHRPQYLLRLEFGDARATSPGQGRVLSPGQAEQIAAFVYAHKETVQTLICQCGFGRSRSAALEKQSQAGPV